MKSIIRKQAAFVAGLAATLFISFAALAQTPSDIAANQHASAPPIYAQLTKRLFAKPLPRGCFCDEVCFDALRRQERFRPNLKLWPELLNRENEIRVIDFEGLKKFLQRDPKDTRPLLINFWATWCDTCREEFPDLVKIDQDYRAKGLNFVAISLDDVTDIDTKVVGFLKEVSARMPVIVLNVPDAEPAIHFVDPNWGGEMPATFLFDKDGKVAFKYFGKIKPDELRAAIDKQLAVKQ